MLKGERTFKGGRMEGALKGKEWEGRSRGRDGRNAQGEGQEKGHSKGRDYQGRRDGRRGTQGGEGCSRGIEGEECSRGREERRDIKVEGGKEGYQGGGMLKGKKGVPKEDTQRRDA